jgi:hypothetical protein
MNWGVGRRLFSFLCGRRKNRGNFPEIYSSKPCLARLLKIISTDYHTKSRRAGRINKNSLLSPVSCLLSPEY